MTLSKLPPSLPITRKEPLAAEKKDPIGKKESSSGAATRLALAALAMSCFALLSRSDTSKPLPIQPPPVQDPCEVLSNCPAVQNIQNTLQDCADGAASNAHALERLEANFTAFAAASVRKLDSVLNWKNDFSAFDAKTKQNLDAVSDALNRQKKDLLSAFSRSQADALKGGERIDEFLKILGNQVQNQNSLLSTLQTTLSRIDLENLAGRNAGNRTEDSFKNLQEQVKNLDSRVSALPTHLSQRILENLAEQLDALSRECQNRAGSRESPAPASSSLASAFSYSTAVMIQLVGVVSQANWIFWLILLPRLSQTRIGNYLLAPLIPSFMSLQAISSMLSTWLQSNIRTLPVPEAESIRPFSLPAEWNPGDRQFSLIQHLTQPSI